ncbi:MAG: hypothetical protein ACJASQ_002726 [Crocinitomicaceae bacterium]|jgi:hypothetical protein
MESDVAILLYKITCLLVGLACCYMGFMLFLKGIEKESGEFKASFKGTSIVLRQVAPGVFFALFGASIIITTIATRSYYTDSYTETSPILEEEEEEEGLGLPEKLPE